MSVICISKEIPMTNEEIELIAKPVKDMYGTSMGTILGTITDIDGSIQTVGVDCGFAGLQQIPFEQLVVQNDVVIFVPKWRLDSQRLIREKGLALRRLQALMDIVSENDEMKEDAEIIHEKYKARLISLDESEQQIRAKLDERLAELDVQLKAAKTVVFDAKIQYKSNEIASTKFELIKKQTDVIVEHITHETGEIGTVQKRIVDLDMEIKETSEPPRQHIEESAVTYLANNIPDIQTKLPEAPTTQPTSEPSDTVNPPNYTEPPKPVTAETSKESTNTDSDWLTRMEAQ